MYRQQVSIISWMEDPIIADTGWFKVLEHKWILSILNCLGQFWRISKNKYSLYSTRELTDSEDKFACRCVPSIISGCIGYHLRSKQKKEPETGEATMLSIPEASTAVAAGKFTKDPKLPAVLISSVWSGGHAMAGGISSVNVGSTKKNYSIDYFVIFLN